MMKIHFVVYLITAFVSVNTESLGTVPTEAFITNITASLNTVMNEFNLYIGNVTSTLVDNIPVLKKNQMKDIDEKVDRYDKYAKTLLDEIKSKGKNADHCYTGFSNDVQKYSYHSELALNYCVSELQKQLTPTELIDKQITGAQEFLPLLDQVKISCPTTLPQFLAGTINDNLEWYRSVSKQLERSIIESVTLLEISINICMENKNYSPSDYHSFFTRTFMMFKMCVNNVTN